VASIDVRPDTGKLYALTNEGNVYTVVVGANDATMTGVSFGIDFNPSADRLRVVSNTRQNLRINPNDGTLAGTDPLVFYPLAGNCLTSDPLNAPQIIGVAYRNNFGGALGFDNAAGDNNGLLQYGIDSRTSRLVKMGSASLNDGCVLEIGAGLGVTLTADDLGGFDISQATGAAMMGTGFVLGAVANGKHDDAVAEPEQRKAVNLLAVIPAGAEAPGIWRSNGREFGPIVPFMVASIHRAVPSFPPSRRRWPVHRSRRVRGASAEAGRSCSAPCGGQQGTRHDREAGPPCPSRDARAERRLADRGAPRRRRASHRVDVPADRPRLRQW
jgi:hypothetical protein